MMVVWNEREGPELNIGGGGGTKMARWLVFQDGEENEKVKEERREIR
jgi:hypothetical protein